MPIYEYYCPDNHRIYQFYAKTLAQGKIIPACPDNPKYRLEKIVSRFAVNTRGRSEGESAEGGAETPADPAEAASEARMEAEMTRMESEFAGVDENDPKAMGRMMRRMAEISGEKMDGEMEEVVRKLEEGVDPESLEDRLGEAEGEGEEGDTGAGLESPGAPAAKKREPRSRLKALRRAPPTRDPKLYDYT